jgi:hypothetical protein
VGSGTPGITGTRGRAAPPAGPLSGRSRLVLLASAVIFLLGIGGVAVWAAHDPGRYSSSGEGCVTLTVPNSTGGAVLHACGDPARAMCRSAFAGTDRIAMLTRPQCDIAGLDAAVVKNRS